MKEYEEIWSKYEEYEENNYDKICMNNMEEYEGDMKKYEEIMKKYEGITLPIYGPWDLEKFLACLTRRGGGWSAKYEFRGGG